MDKCTGTKCARCFTNQTAEHFFQQVILKGSHKPILGSTQPSLFCHFDGKHQDSESAVVADRTVQDKIVEGKKTDGQYFILLRPEWLFKSF